MIRRAASPSTPGRRLATLTLTGVAALGTAAACDGVLPAPDLERMITQRNVRPYEPSTLFADGRAMRSPPEGTISRDRVIGRPVLTDGLVEGRYVTDVPLADVGGDARAVMQRGRDRFDLFCAACHGLRGDGASPVALNMDLRRPPSLLIPPVTSFPPGRLYQVITEGYGLMPSYAAVLPVRDRWATVAYLAALQRSQSVRLDDLPADMRTRAEKVLP
jgi:mono/diheme cytochrome c family protein